MGHETGDDAGVFRISPDQALIQTVDFFAPIVDDPYTFGRIAATNSLSDVYAMGGRPLTAMNIVGFPKSTMSLDVLNRILKGGLDTIKEAGALLVGGHTVEDGELKYGLSVTGVVHPDKVLTNAGTKPGDILVLTKPIGTGIIATALKRGKASEASVKTMIENMTTLNRIASEVMQEIGVHGCTDVTGFGLIGHAHEMMKASGVGMEIDAARVPLMNEVLDYAEQKLVPGGAGANQKFYAPNVNKADSVSDSLFTVLQDPQTAGGLFISVSKEKADDLLESLHKKGCDSASAIGRCTASSGSIEVK